VKKLILFSLILMLTLSMVAYGENTGEVYNLRFGHSQAEGNPLDNATKEFIRLVEEKTDGRVKITSYPNMILGNDLAMLEGVQMGTMDIMFVPASVILNFDPSYTAWDIPFLFNDYEHVIKATKGEFMQQKLDSLGQYNLKGLGYWSCGFLKFITTKPIAELADLKGTIIRCMESAPVMTWLAAYGANPVPMAWSEVPTAIQTGAVHGTMISPIVGYTARLSAVADYFTNNWGVYYSPMVVVTNKKLFDSLPMDIQTAIYEATDEATDKFFKEWQAALSVYTQKMVDDDGITLVNSTEEQIAEFIQYTKDNVWPLMIEKGFITQEELDLVRSLVE